MKPVTKHQIRTMQMGLWMAGVNVDNLTAEVIALTVEGIAKKGGEFSLREGAKIHAYIQGKAYLLHKLNTKMLSIPFTPEQIKKLTAYQDSSTNEHPYTCGGSTHKDRKKKCQRILRTGEGKLTVTEKGLVCPCGLYKQTWAHDLP